MNKNEIQDQYYTRSTTWESLEKLLQSVDINTLPDYLRRLAASVLRQARAFTFSRLDRKTFYKLLWYSDLSIFDPGHFIQLIARDYFVIRNIPSVKTTESGIRLYASTSKANNVMTLYNTFYNDTLATAIKSKT